LEPGVPGLKRLIVTADDFGLSHAVNDAVEAGHRRGILSAASLMVAGEAAADAVARARRMPRLGVGLHLVLCDGKPVLAPERLPHLVDAAGRFPDGLATLGARIGLGAAARREAEAEIRAQLAAFRATGLGLDHVNAHHHFHFHPVVRDILIRLAPEFGIRALRIPREPAWSTWRAAGDRPLARLLNRLMLGWFAARLARRLDRARIAHNDWQLGLSDTGAMDAARVTRLLTRLPDGVSEIYFHPSADPADPGHAELAALLDPAIAALLEGQGIAPIAFAALAETVHPANAPAPP
jgi:hopanoid biosynthesis associated protein HpnK